MEHISDGAAGCDGIDGDLLLATVLCQASDEGVYRRFRGRIERVLGYSEVDGRIGAHENDAAALAKVFVRFSCNEELAAGVDIEDTIEFVLRPPLTFDFSESRHPYLGDILEVSKAHHSGI